MTRRADSFDVFDYGTAETDWAPVIDAITGRLQRDLLPPSVVIVAAHPDDDALGSGGLMHHAAHVERAVTVILATSGEASHPLSPTTDSETLATLRREEERAALAGLSGAIDLIELTLPDGALDDHHDTLTAAIVDTITAGPQPTLIVAPWRHDGHPDHAAAGRAAAAAAARTDSPLAEYPIWFWHWGKPADFPHDDAAIFPLSPEDTEAKRQAIETHASQIHPLSPAAGDEAIVPPHIRDHFRRNQEVLLLTPSPSDDTAFELLHRTNCDPWSTQSNYEVSKRAHTLSFLDGIARPAHALEIGCSVGALSVDLAGRCDNIDAMDASPAATRLARERTADLSTVHVLLGAAPNDIPHRRYDLIVLSEVGYFLSPNNLQHTLANIAAITPPGAHLLACHWLHPIRGWPLDGQAVHAAISRAFGAPERTETTTDYVLELWALP